MIEAINLYKGSKIRKGVYLNIIATTMLAVIGIVPLLDRDLDQAIRLGIFFFWIVTLPSVGSLRGNALGKKIIIGWLVFFLLQALYSLIGMSRELTYFLARLYIYALPVAMVYVTSFYNRKELNILWYSILFVFVFCLVQNFFIGSTGDDEIFEITSEVRGSNVGGTAFVTGCMFIIPSLWLVFKKGDKKLLRFISIGVIGGSVFYMLVLNSRTTLLVVFGVLVAGMIMADRSVKRAATKRLVFRMVLLLIVMMVIAAPILTKLAGYYGDVLRMSDRLEDLAFAAGGGDINDLGRGSLYYRYLLWQASITTFFSSVPNFLFGVGEKEVVLDLYSHINSGVGGHSEIFDLAARYGIIGIMIYFYMISKTFRFLLRITKDMRIKNCMVVVLTCVVMYSFVNNTTTQACTMVMLYLFMPITLILLNNEEL